MAAMNQSGADGSETELDEEPDPNDLLEILSNRRRRLLWQLLRQRSNEMELNDASRRIAALENDIDPREVTYDQRKSVYNSLRQFHCQKMEEAGLIDFDKREGTIRPSTELSEDLTVTIKPDCRSVFGQITGSLGIASVVVLGSWGLDLPVFGSLPLSAVLLSLAGGAAGAVFVYSLLMRTEFRLSLADALSRVDT